MTNWNISTNEVLAFCREEIDEQVAAAATPAARRLAYRRRAMLARYEQSDVDSMDWIEALNWASRLMKFAEKVAAAQRKAVA